MEIEFQGQYDKAAVFRAVSLANQPSKRGFLLRIGLAVLFIILYAAYFINVAGKDTLSSFDLFRSGRHLITLLFIAYFLFQPYIAAYFAASNIWKDPGMQRPQAGVISNQGVAYISSTGNRTEIAWERFAKKRMKENLIVLLTADGVISFFPRNFFKTDADWERAQKMVDFKVVEAV